MCWNNRRIVSLTLNLLLLPLAKQKKFSYFLSLHWVERFFEFFPSSYPWASDAAETLLGMQGFAFQAYTTRSKTNGYQFIHLFFIRNCTKFPDYLLVIEQKMVKKNRNFELGKIISRAQSASRSKGKESSCFCYQILQIQSIGHINIDKKTLSKLTGIAR